MNLNIRKIVFTIKIINLNTIIFVEKSIIALIFEIKSNSINIIIILINQDQIILLKIIMQ